MKVTMTERMGLDPDADFFTAGDAEKLVYCASPASPTPARDSGRGDRRRRRPAGEDAPAHRRPRRARRRAADGRGRGEGAHAVPDRGPRRRAAVGRRPVLRRRLAGAPASSATDASRGTPTAARGSRRSARSATWCCSATRSRPASRATDGDDRAPPPATIRTQVPLPLRFPDGYTSLARAFTFDGLADGREHLAFGLGDRAAPRSPRPRTRCRWSGRTASASPATSSAASAATAARSCARRSSGSPTPAATCCTCGRRDAASASTPSSTPTRCRTPGWTPTRPTSRSATREDERATPSPRRCSAPWASTRVALLSNNPDKAGQLDGSG